MFLFHLYFYLKQVGKKEEEAVFASGLIKCIIIIYLASASIDMLVWMEVWMRVVSVHVCMG